MALCFFPYTKNPSPIAPNNIAHSIDASLPTARLHLVARRQNRPGGLVPV
jgi:hypothetical protein